MPHHFLKPIFWTPTGYTGPGGHTSAGGFPYEHGWAHEEWNALPARIGDQVAFFATVSEASKAGLEALAGHITLLMYASHGTQDLVGVARNTTHLTLQHQRDPFIRQIDLDERREQAWAVETVREAYEDDRAEFEACWTEHAKWAVNWSCRREDFLWLPVPKTLDARRITGSAHLPHRYRTTQRIEAEAAEAAISGLPFGTRQPTLAPGVNTRRIGNGRDGQAAFRLALDRFWEGACAVTGCELRAVLRASHVKPWSQSTPDERTDPDNGLLLDANLDRLFDEGLITFEDDGALRVSKLVPVTARRELRLNGKRLRKQLSVGARSFMQRHRTQVFRDRDLA